MGWVRLTLFVERSRVIGGRVPQFPDVETAKKVQVDYTLAAAKASLEALAPQLPTGQKFRFVFCSGKFAEWDQGKSLAFMQDTRRIKVRQPTTSQKRVELTVTVLNANSFPLGFGREGPL